MLNTDQVAIQDWNLILAALMTEAKHSKLQVEAMRLDTLEMVMHE